MIRKARLVHVAVATWVDPDLVISVSAGVRPGTLETGIIIQLYGAESIFLAKCEGENLIDLVGGITDLINSERTRF